MSDETKQDVVDELTDALYDLDIDKKIADKLHDEYRSRYEAALPDDLPVIPEAISDAIKFYWTTYGSGKGLTDLLFDLVEPWRIGVDKVVSAIHEDLRKYYLLHSDVIARAWVLGVWRVEETGEVVKLEAEK